MIVSCQIDREFELALRESMKIHNVRRVSRYSCKIAHIPRSLATSK